ncbi:MAG: coproporphyrinogen dehydrogenase HemZ [Clostridia bacterium]|nr:coproporphyrinogen dehydrogenase HemZ [Clostridia bacterium]
MNIKTDSPVNKYYVQTLCMIFFPGEKFGEREDENPDTPSLYLKTEKNEEGIGAYAEIKLGDKCCSAERFAPFSSDFSEERTMKIAVGAAILAVGGELMGYRPSWGMLIGVRPSKVATEMLNMGMSKTKVKKTLVSDYLVIPKKAALAVDVALNEKRISGSVGTRDCSVYVSIPFCPTRCTYCSFVSYTSKRLLDLIPQYLDRLLCDIEANFKVIKELGLNVKTVYIGGGTPTILNAEQLKRLLAKIASLTDVSALAEYTLESGRPDTITAEKFAIAREYGVTRVSVNPQTLCDEVLSGIGRSHTVEQFFEAYDIAKASGIKTVNVDLIAGLPGDNFKVFSSSYDRILQLRPENITVHTFCVKKSAEMLRINSHIYSIKGGDAGKCVDYSQIKAIHNGYLPYYMYRQKNTVGNYENVGFSLEGHEGLYNIYMMEELHSIFAAGAGAVTKLVDNTGNKIGGKSIERLFNQKYPYEYLKEDRSSDFREAAIKFYTEHSLL